MSDLTNKDAEQDKQIAVLENYFGSIRERVIGLEERMTRKDDYDRLEKNIDELKNRVRQLERWVWGAAAVIAVGAFVIGIAANSQEVSYGRNGSPQQEVLL
jgi:predicted nuclease with TOPRIM domain